MVKYCVVPDINGGPDLEWELGTYPGAVGECISQGGTVKDRERGGGCGTTEAVSVRSESVSKQMSHTSPIVTAIVRPIQILRNRLSDCEILRDLEVINYSPDFVRLMKTDKNIQNQIRDAAGMVSNFAFLALVDSHSQTLRRSCYTKETHQWLTEIGRSIQEKVEDDELRAAIDRLILTFNSMIGEPIGDILMRVSRNSSTASSVEKKDAD